MPEGKIFALGLVCLTLGCAATKACPPPEPKIQPQAVAKPPAEIRYMEVRPRVAPPNVLLIETYQDTLNQEKDVAIKAKSPGVILKLIPYDEAARKAMVPIIDPQHVATGLEVKRAIIAEGALAAYLNSVKEPK